MLVRTSSSECGLVAGRHKQAALRSLQDDDLALLKRIPEKAGFTDRVVLTLRWSGKTGRRGRRQKCLTVDSAYRGSDGVGHLLIDNTGIKESKWQVRCFKAQKTMSVMPRPCQHFWLSSP